MTAIDDLKKDLENELSNIMDGMQLDEDNQELVDGQRRQAAKDIGSHTGYTWVL